MNRKLSAGPSLPSLFAGFLLLLAAASPAVAAWRPVGPATSLDTVVLPAAPVGALYTARIDSLLRSTDEGAIWSTSDFSLGCAFDDVSHLATDPAQSGRLYAAEGIHVVASADGGVTWQLSTDPGIGRVIDLIAAPGQLLAVGDSSGLPSLSPRPPCYPSPDDNGVARSTDGGATWTVLTSAPAGSGHYTAVAVDADHPERLYLGTSTGDVFVSTDGGAIAVALPRPTPLQVEELRLDAATRTLFALSAQQIFRTALTADGNAGPWTRLVGAPLAKSLAGNLILDPHQPGTLYAFSSQGVFVSTDRGDSWQSIPGGPAPSTITALALDPRPNGPLYAATQNGLFAFDRSRCVVDSTSTCLSGFRYRVAATFELPGGPATPAHPRALSADTADAWFFAPENLELLVKVLDGRGVNGDFWVFSGGLSDVRYTLTVTDTQTGAVKSYVKPAGRLSSFADTSAFPVGSVKNAAGKAAAPPEAAPAALFLPDATGCTGSDRALCLSGSRFAVTISYSGGPFAGDGHAVPLTSDTGAFWFLTPDNLELAVKVLDGRGVNGRFWVFYGALTDFAYTLTVTDTETGAVKTYKNPRGRLASFADTSAF